MGRFVSIEPKLVCRSAFPAKAGGVVKSIFPYEVTMFALMSGGLEGEQSISMPPKLEVAVMLADVMFRQVMPP